MNAARLLDTDIRIAEAKVRQALALIAAAQGAADWDAAEMHSRTLNADLDHRDALYAEFTAATGRFPHAR